MEATKINETEVKKELMKSKVNAKLSHYVSGNIYYTVDLADGTYQFPISTIEKIRRNNSDKYYHKILQGENLLEKVNLKHIQTY